MIAARKAAKFAEKAELKKKRKLEEKEVAKRKKKSRAKNRAPGSMLHKKKAAAKRTIGK